MTAHVKTFVFFGMQQKPKQNTFRQTNVAFSSADVVSSKEDVDSSLYAIVFYIVDLIIAATPVTFLP